MVNDALRLWVENRPASVGKRIERSRYNAYHPDLTQTLREWCLTLRYKAVLKPKALKDLQQLSATMQTRILEKVELMQNDLQGDVKRLTNFTPEYRLRVGHYRILFEIENGEIVIYRIKHRSAAYS